MNWLFSFRSVFVSFRSLFVPSVDCFLRYSLLLILLYAQKMFVVFSYTCVFVCVCTCLFVHTSLYIRFSRSAHPNIRFVLLACLFSRPVCVHIASSFGWMVHVITIISTVSEEVREKKERTRWKKRKKKRRRRKKQTKKKKSFSTNKTDDE
jgi:cytochrome b subunit of formate dehydrogenase